ncbi:hypothetical protein L873DRAFT_1244579 [Choiromyces venosus 120613-1]|uniref:Uncharacterized protein n=1 Tax=Choiromyces venosus 120613-1 TaxID=1336337 RepID=A0A3N4JDC7_9PEZI|nr:hypothetical protein L873DRAFT_1244579 [Choiromyces venosus 120613-1]
MLPTRLLFSSLFSLLAIFSNHLSAEPLEARGNPDTKVATILPSFIVPISSCNAQKVFPSQEHGGVWLKPSLEHPKSRPQCIGNNLICKMNETALYGEFGNSCSDRVVANERVYKVRFQVPFNSARYCEFEFNLPPSGARRDWRVRGTGILNVFGLAEPLNPHGVNWGVRPKRAPNTRSSSPDSPLYLIEHSISDRTTSCRGPRLECRMGSFMDFELSVHRPGYTFFDWQQTADPPTGMSLGNCIS